eukprot:2717005-Amphidinium_carterae.1
MSQAANNLRAACNNASARSRRTCCDATVYPQGLDTCVQPSQEASHNRGTSHQSQTEHRARSARIGNTCKIAPPGIIHFSCARTIPRL